MSRSVGYYIEDLLLDCGIPNREFAKHAGIEPEVLDDIIHERRGIDEEIAQKLAKATYSSAAFWLKIQDNYNKNETIC